MKHNKMILEIRTYAELQSQLKAIQTLTLKWKQFDEKTYRQIQQIANTLLHFTYSTNSAFQALSKEQQFAIQTSQHELGAILKDWKESNFSDHIHLLKTMLISYLSNLKAFAPAPNPFSRNLLAEINFFCEQVRQKQDINTLTISNLGKQVQHLVHLSMTPEFLGIERVEEIGNFIDQMDRIWSKKISSVQDYLSFLPSLQQKVKNFQQFINADNRMNKAA